MKKIISLLLVIFMLAGLTTALAAEQSKFFDVEEQELLTKLQLLDELGVVSGYPDGSYKPAQLLKRSEFTKLVVTLLGKADAAALFAGYTIFTDVPSGHWAASFINLASRSADKGGLALIKGYPDGSFKPDATINYGEAVTILLRALGYTDDMVGYDWPNDYTDRSADEGLADGLALAAADSVSRADGARLFYNALFVVRPDGTRLIDGAYGEVIASALVIAVDADGVSIYGREDKLLNAAGLTAADDIGKRYKLTLWSDNEKIMLAEPVSRRTTTVDRAAITDVFAEDGFIYLEYNGLEALCLAAVDSTWKNTEAKLTLDRETGVILAAEQLADSDRTSTTIAFAYYSGDSVTATDGSVVKIPADTTVYTTEKGVSGDSTTFGLLRDHLSYGDRLELVYDADDKLLHVLTLTGETSYLVLDGHTKTEALAALGAPADAKIYKNGFEVGFADLVAHTVLSRTAAGAVNACDFRLTASYTLATPNAAAPTALVVFDDTLALAPTAAASVSAFAAGEPLTLLFAADGTVAGALEPTASTAADRPVGYYTGTSIEFVGGVELAMTIASAAAGDLVSYAGVDASGAPLVYPLRYDAPSAALDVAAKTLGDHAISPSVRIFERASATSPLVEIELGDLAVSTVAKEKILHASFDTSGGAALVVLGDVTGDRYTYGRVSRVVEERTAHGTLLSAAYNANIITVEGEASVTAAAPQTLAMPSGLADSTDLRKTEYAWGGVLFAPDADGVATEAAAIALFSDPLPATRASFVGSTAVRVAAAASTSTTTTGAGETDESAATTTIPIADGVLVFIDATESFMDSSAYADRLQLVSAARAQSDSFDLYVAAGKVRIIVVK